MNRPEPMKRTCQDCGIEATDVKNLPVLLRGKPSEWRVLCRSCRDKASSNAPVIVPKPEREPYETIAPMVAKPRIVHLADVKDSLPKNWLPKTGVGLKSRVIRVHLPKTRKPKQAKGIQVRATIHEKAMKNVRTRGMGVSTARAREFGVASDFYIRDWRKAIAYFGGCCAICGRQGVDLFGERTLSVDHWIPLVRGGTNTPDNIVPLCHGVDGCNNKKHDAMPMNYLTKTYGSRKAKAIMEKIETFFQSVRQTREEQAS